MGEDTDDFWESVRLEDIEEFECFLYKFSENRNIQFEMTYHFETK